MNKNYNNRYGHNGQYNNRRYATYNTHKTNSAQVATENDQPTIIINAAPAPTPVSTSESKKNSFFSILYGVLALSCIGGAIYLITTLL